MRRTIHSPSRKPGCPGSSDRPVSRNPSRSRRRPVGAGRYLALFNGAADEADLTEQQQTELINAWASWAQGNEKAIVDPGAPLNAKKLVTARGVEEFTDALTGYTIVEAGSHDEAVQIFSGHPHLGLFAGNSIAVLECPPPPS